MELLVFQQFILLKNMMVKKKMIVIICLPSSIKTSSGMVASGMLGNIAFYFNFNTNTIQ